MAIDRMVDTQVDPGPLTFEDNASTEPVTDDSVAAVEPVIPEKFKGKSTEEIIKSYQELESLNGRQSQEIGELRRVADNYIMQTSQPTKVTSDESTSDVGKSDVDIYEDPDAFVANRVKEMVKPLEERLKENEHLRVQQALREAHPDYMQVSADPRFLEWVGSDDYRRRQFVEANNHDFHAADNLLSTFKALEARKAEVEAQEQEEQLKAASTVEGGTGQTSKTIYNRAALIQLQNTDPVRYESLQPEIMQAYREGRVK